jgi:hypothetical protein
MPQFMRSRSLKWLAVLSAFGVMAPVMVLRADVPSGAQLAAIACAPETAVLVVASTPLFSGTTMRVDEGGCPAGQSGCMPGMCNCGGIGQPQCCDGTCICVCATSCCSAGDDCEVRED